MYLKGKNALITGGGAGFGLALTQRLLENGANVVVFDSNSQSISSLSNDFPSVKSVLCDISDDAQLDKAVEIASSHLGCIDILVNNAGIMRSAPLINLLSREDKRHSRELWHQVMNVNLNAVFYISSTVAAKMLSTRTKGIIVNISSVASQGNAGQSAYSASKAAVEALTKVWAKELSPLGIRSVAIAPGFANSQGACDALEEKYLNDWVSKTPLGRLGEVDEVVDAILFCIKNDFFNGQILKIDGGLVI